MSVNQAQESLIVIPAYNEADHLGPVLEELRQMNCRVLVVDDGSTDKTAELARAAGAAVVSLGRNQGKGAAIQRAVRELSERNCRWVIFMDADGQHAPRDIRSFEKYAASSGAGFFCGSRFAARPFSMPWIRLWTNRLLSGVMSLAIHQRIEDPQCGFRMISKELLLKLRLTADRFEIDNDMLFEAARLKARVFNVPVACIYNNKRSHIQPIRDTLRLAGFIASRMIRSFGRRGAEA